jgi:hypothetical protein
VANHVAALQLYLVVAGNGVFQLIVDGFQVLIEELEVLAHQRAAEDGQVGKITWLVGRFKGV